MNVHLTVAALAVTAVIAAGCASQQEKSAGNTLVAPKVAVAPKLAAGASDPAWGAATPITVRLAGGANFGGTGATTATLKAVYSGDTLYMLVQYADPTNSIRRFPLVKQPDGSWKRLGDPANKGGDDNMFYEDKWAFLWPINNSVKGFDQQGCMVACHLGESKPYGNKYTNTEGEMLDMWHMKGMRTAPAGYVDDQYTDHTRYDAQKSPNAGRKGDPGGAEYSNVPVVNGRPQFMNADGKPGNAGGKYYIIKGTEVPFDDTKFKAGDEVASHFSHPLANVDRTDVSVVNFWSNGTLTSVLSRKLVTGSKYDVQFNNLDARYAFGFAAFDNAQVRHAVHFDPLYLRFER
jgi:hypothetical protein